MIKNSEERIQKNEKNSTVNLNIDPVQMTNEGRLNAQFFMNTKFFQNHSAGMLQKKGLKVSRIISDHNMEIKI